VRQQRAPPRVVGHQRADLSRSALEKTLRRSRSGGAALLEQSDGLGDERRDRVQPRQQIVVVAGRTRRRDRERERHVLLDAAVLRQRHFLLGKTKALDLAFEAADEEVEIEPILGLEEPAIDRSRLRELLAGPRLDAFDPRRRKVAPDLVVAGEADVRRELGMVAELVFERLVEQTVQAGVLSRARLRRLGGGRRGGPRHRPEHGQQDDRSQPPRRAPRHSRTVHAAPWWATISEPKRWPA
jgi:hypothetical protein